MVSIAPLPQKPWREFRDMYLPIAKYVANWILLDALAAAYYPWRIAVLMSRLYCCWEVKGRSCWSGRSLYFSSIDLATSFNGTRTVTGRFSFVFLAIYSTNPFTTFAFIIAHRSDTRHPITLWNMNISLCRSKCRCADKSASWSCFLSARVM